MNPVLLSASSDAHVHCTLEWNLGTIKCACVFGLSTMIGSVLLCLAQKSSNGHSNRKIFRGLRAVVGVVS